MTLLLRFIHRYPRFARVSGVFALGVSFFLTLFLLTDLFVTETLFLSTTGEWWTTVVFAFVFAILGFTCYTKKQLTSLSAISWCVVFFYTWVGFYALQGGYIFSLVHLVLGDSVLLGIILLMKSSKEEVKRTLTVLLLWTSLLLLFGEIAQRGGFSPRSYVALLLFFLSFHWYMKKEYFLHTAKRFGFQQTAHATEKTYQQIMAFFTQLTARNQPFVEPSSRRVRTLIFGAVLLLTILGGMLRLGNLGNESFYHDEFFHMAAAKGYLETGKPVLWNFITNTPTPYPYGRNIEYTAMIAQMYSWFGVNEFSARFPGAFIGTLCIPLAFFVFRRGFGTSVALMTTAIFTFSDPAIFFARFVRGYNFLPFFLLIALWFLFITIERTERFKKSSRETAALLLCMAGVGGAFFFALRFGVLIGTFIPFIVLSFLLLLIAFTYREKKLLSPRNLLYGSVALIIVEVFLLNYFNILPILNIQHIFSQDQLGWLESPRLIYSDYLFQHFYRIKSLAKICMVLGFFALLSHYRFKGLLLSVVLVGSLFTAMFTWARYEDLRYIDFMQPLAMVVIAAGFVFLMRIIFLLVQLLIHKKSVRIPLASAAGALLFFGLITPSFPGVHIPHFTRVAQRDWKTDEGDRVHRRAVAPKYREAMIYISEHAEAGDILAATTAESRAYVYLPNAAQYDTYGIDRWTTLFLDLESPDRRFVEAADLLDSEKRLWVLIDYAHLVDQTFLKTIRRQCADVSKHIPGNFVYNYNETYNNQYHWPTVYRCDKN